MAPAEVLWNYFRRFWNNFILCRYVGFRRNQGGFTGQIQKFSISSPPSTLRLELVDIRAASEWAHKNGMIVVVDNTFCSPVLQKPLDLGADVVLHSVTKFINGHADIVGGALVAKREDHAKLLKKTMAMMGGKHGPSSGLHGSKRS